MGADLDVQRGAQSVPVDHSSNDVSHETQSTGLTREMTDDERSIAELQKIANEALENGDYDLAITSFEMILSKLKIVLRDTLGEVTDALGANTEKKAQLAYEQADIALKQIKANRSKGVLKGVMEAFKTLNLVVSVASFLVAPSPLTAFFLVSSVTQYTSISTDGLTGGKPLLQHVSDAIADVFEPLIGEEAAQVMTALVVSVMVAVITIKGGNMLGKNKSLAVLSDKVKTAINNRLPQFIQKILSGKTAQDRLNFTVEFAIAVGELSEASATVGVSYLNYRSTQWTYDATKLSSEHDLISQLDADLQALFEEVQEDYRQTSDAL